MTDKLSDDLLSSLNVTGDDNRTNPVESAAGDAQPHNSTGGYLAINFSERHCIFCDRLTPYTLNWDDGWLRKMWLCWQHLSSKMRREMQDFYAEIIESNTTREREERDEP